MKRNIKCFAKYVLLVLCTAFVTTVVFKIVRRFQKSSARHELSSRMLLLQNEHLNINESDFLIDWHDYAAIDSDRSRTGIGEHGNPAQLPKSYSHEKYNNLYDTNGFNALLSDYISVNRSIKDIRHPDCKKMKYHRNLPTVSVIVPFHNEHWSTLLRTVYSVLNRSPSKLLKEIILVDDFSSKDHTKRKLDEFVRDNLPKVKVIHLESRQGLIRGRLAGARNASGEVLVFLDSHSEANVNWLPPLLDPIAEDYRTCVCPFIDVIAFDTFEYRAQDEGARGGFDWELYYKRLPLLPEDTQVPTRPFKSPVMAGGLFAISARFFWELGGYDPGLYIWGGEQYELSFKIWQCGGRMFDAPCSRVGHIYRKFAPFPNPGIGDFVGKNYRRVAEVWMDEYAEYLYKKRPHYRMIDPGDLTEQLAIRKRLKCKPFKWFMENVAFDLVKKYPPVEPPNFATGKIRNYVATEYCVSWKTKSKPLFLEECDESKHMFHQDFDLTWRKDIKARESSLCWDVSDPGHPAPVTLFGCHGSQGNQLWRFDDDKMWLIHGGNPRCLDCNLKKKTIYVTECDSTSETQKWIIDNVNKDALTNWHADM